MKKDEKKLQNEREWYGGWDDIELEKHKYNLGIEDGADLECIKMIILFILNVYYHISYYWVSLLRWDEKP